MDQTLEKKLNDTAERLGLPAENMPRNIAIIMDGNGRWAQQMGLPRAEGHRQGGKIVERTALTCVDFGVRSLTLYSFSSENWKRPKLEVDALMHLYSQYLVSIRPMLMKNNVKMVHLGRLDQLPAEVKTELFKTIELTAQNTGMTLALALNYSGRTEIVDATRKIAQECKTGQLAVDAIDEDCISRHLYTSGLPDPDLLIRTANERRVSNFLLWQISYTEFYVTEKCWPDFNKEELEKAIIDYAGRIRRFGNIGSAAKNQPHPNQQGDR